MKDIKKLLDKRKSIKRKKPDFVMQNAHMKSRLEKKWRKPRGIDSKIRLRLKGYLKPVETGYGSPKEIKHLHKSGLMPVLISSLKELENIDNQKQAIVISSKVGKKKKLDIIKKADEKSITILNIKDTKKYADEIIKAIEERKKRREKRQKKKADIKKEKKEKKDDKLAEKIMSEEEKAEAEKKEKDKILTKKDA
jgi:large subunit ribosomal protein L32e